MGSFSPSTTTTTTTLSTISRRSFFPSKPSQLSAFHPNQARRTPPKMTSSFNAANNTNGDDDNHQIPKSTTNNVDSTSFDRRNFLVGGLCGAAAVINTAEAAETSATTTTPTVTFPKPLDKIIRTNLTRPITSRSKKEKSEEEEVLIIEVETKSDVYSKFDVYINDEDEAPTKENRTQTEYAGSFVNVPHKDKRGAGSDNLITTSVKFGLSELIDDLGADDDDGIDVIFVPRTGTESMVIKDVRIEFLT